MSAYNFAPCPDLSTKEENIAYWENGFTEEQIQNIIRYGDSLRPSTSSIGEKNKTKEIADIRKSKNSWIKLNDETAWLYDSMAYIARQLNGQYFDFDLYGFVEDFQYTVYDGNMEDHYSWHVDKGRSTLAPRKLSLVLQLSDPSEYEGGDLELQYDTFSTKAIKRKGILYAFPSWILHRVTPVTSGIRRSLVVWVAGPKFR